VDDALERLVFGAFYQSGQSCISVQRTLVHDAIYDASWGSSSSGSGR
jgi:acyl-CoA reductase-like NAD-dependent aldehyde dehydrogenase